MAWVPNSVPALLRAFSVAPYSVPDRILELEGGTTCAAALRAMKEVGITGAPVFEWSDGESLPVRRHSHRRCCIFIIIDRLCTGPPDQRDHPRQALRWLC